MNLLKETMSILNRKLERINVRWVGSKGGKYAITWEEFCKQAKDFEYDNGFGSNEVPEDLVVVGADWWLERVEYDGSEWWSFKRVPCGKVNAKPFKLVTGYYDLESTYYPHR
jgi:hypothetical protein